MGAGSVCSTFAKMLIYSISDTVDEIRGILGAFLAASFLAGSRRKLRRHALRAPLFRFHK